MRGAIVLLSVSALLAGCLERRQICKPLDKAGEQRLIARTVKHLRERELKRHNYVVSDDKLIHCCTIETDRTKRSVVDRFGPDTRVFYVIFVTWKEKTGGWGVLTYTYDSCLNPVEDWG